MTWSWSLGSRRPGSPVSAVAALLLILALTACGSDKPPVPVSAPKTALDFFPLTIGGKVVRLQLAIRPDEMQRGLMDRQNLGADDGMMFIYEKPQQMHFWMRNTPTPLDIGFFDRGGVLEEIYPLYPFDERTVSSRSERLHFAVEVNQGWFRANGIKPGAQLDLKSLVAALKARGFDPKKYGLE